MPDTSCAQKPSSRSAVDALVGDRRRLPLSSPAGRSMSRLIAITARPTGIRRRASPGRPRALPMMRSGGERPRAGRPPRRARSPTVSSVTVGGGERRPRGRVRVGADRDRAEVGQLRRGERGRGQQRDADGDARRRHHPLGPRERAAGEMPEARRSRARSEATRRGPRRRAARRRACRARPGSAASRARSPGQLDDASASRRWRRRRLVRRGLAPASGAFRRCRPALQRVRAHSDGEALGGP